ncbi:MAG TPA: bifunctional UDP-N-acetylmuramoyl-tripeptide:D-alanyl-D-alanine ligase/alanine racemase [Bacteroides sp.]|nr:bifunctional UDP-N-acetylmuramoyl-tripeptide:D-alanyl-D-alanine ligase/alanine racemase [Bacteroides sp.]
MKYSLQEIAEITGGDLRGSSSEIISRISIDSRTIIQPEGILFLAIRGERHDGHKYIPELSDRGVKAFLVQELPSKKDLIIPGTGFILVGDPLKALHVLAAHHRETHKSNVIGITGSNGKTIVKEWVHQALSPDMQVVRSPKSYNSQVGVPLSVLLMEEKTEMAVFEAGISQPGEMDKLEKIIRPETGIFTNIGEAHQEGFNDREQKIMEKIILFQECRTIIYCRDHEAIHRLMLRQFPEERLFSWTFEEGGDVHAERLQDQSTDARLHVRYAEDEMDITLPFRDRASVENAMHVITLMLFMKIPPLVIQSRIADLTPIAMRMEMVKGINACTLINDTYNSDLVSLSIALDYLNQQNQHEHKTLILSDIMQTGRDEEELYSDVSGMLKKKNIDRLIGIGPDLYRQRLRFPEGARFFSSTSEFLTILNSLEFRDEAILIKGSRVFAFEKITQRLQEKNHRTILEIDLNAMVHNLNVYRSRTNARIMVMVKAFSYGSGSMEIANALQYQKVDYLCVAYVDEGITLREAGIHLPILVMNPEVSGFDLMIDYNLEPEIYNFRSLFTFIRAIGKRNLESYPVHLKLETGMNRLGFSEDELDQLFEVLHKHPGISIRSVFSHLAASEEAEHDIFTRQQIGIFERMSERILEHFPGNSFRHILNSAGIERFPEAGFDMVRLGIGLYGISTDPDNKLQVVSSLKSIISQIKSVKKGESVGYGRNYLATRDTTMGVVPVGYADGLRRDLGKRGISFMVNGSEAPVMGNICMDMCMIDLSGIKAEEGDEVLIFGKEKPVAELAEKLDTIPYEVLAGLSERVKRVYFQE